MKRPVLGIVCLLSVVVASLSFPQAVLSSAPKKFVRPATRAKRKQARAALKGHLSHVSHKMSTVRAKLKQAKRSEADIAEELTTIRRRLQFTRLRLSETRAHLAASKREQKKVALAL